MEFDLEIINTCPIGFRLEVQALDSDHEIIGNVNTECSGRIVPGRIEEPSANLVSISTVFDRDCRSLSALRMRFSADTDEEHSGLSMNENQGFTISSMVATIRNGITIDLNK